MNKKFLHNLKLLYPKLTRAERKEIATYLLWQCDDAISLGQTTDSLKQLIGQEYGLNRSFREFMRRTIR